MRHGRVRVRIPRSPSEEDPARSRVPNRGPCTLCALPPGKSGAPCPSAAYRPLVPAGGHPMPTDPRPPFRRALFAVLTCLSLAAAIGAQTFSDRVHRVTAPEADSAGGFLGITRWGGRLFVLH